MVEEKLNENDHKLLAYCYNQGRHINEIARFLNISPASVVAKVKKLARMNLISISKFGKGKKTYIRTKKGDKTGEYFFSILREIEKRGGEVTLEEFFSLPPHRLEGEYNEDKVMSPFRLLFTRPKLVEEKVSITKEGKKYLKKFSKK